MREVARPLLILHSNAAFREHVRRASERRFDVRWIGSWSALVDAVRDAPPAALVVVDPYLEANGEQAPAPELRAFLREFPSTTVIAAMETRGARFRDIRTLGVWGVVEVISLELEATPEAITQRLRSVRGRPLQAVLKQSLPRNLSSRPLSLLMATAEVVSAGGHARDLARSLCVSRRTLYRWSVRAGLPPPRRLLAWMRVLLAAELLDDPGRTVSSVAYACGYSSDNALRTALTSFLAKTPTKLRREGAFAVVSQAFLAELADLRRRGAREGASHARENSI